MPNRRKPTEIKKAQGTLQKCRQIDHIEPEKINAELALPPPTIEMNDAAKQVWHDTCIVLHKLNVLTEADLHALASYCIATANFWEAQKDIQKNGMIQEIPTRDGVVRRRNPASDIATANYSIMKDGFARFGLSPADRTKIPAVPKVLEKWDEWDLD